MERTASPETASRYRRMMAFGANLSPRGQNARLRGAVVALALALAACVVIDRAELPRAYRLITVVPFFFAAFGAMQGLFRTCPGHSMKGTREGDRGTALPHQGNWRCVKASKRLAVGVLAASLLAAGAATGLFYVLPCR